MGGIRSHIHDSHCLGGILARPYDRQSDILMQSIITIIIVIIAFVILATKIAKMLRNDHSNQCNEDSGSCMECPLKTECNKLKQK